MRNKFSLSKFLGLALMCLVLAGAFGASASALHAPGGDLGSAALTFFKTCLFGGMAGGGGHYAVGGLQVEIWENHIEGNLFKNNEFLLASTDASQYVLMGKVVHIPQAGALPNIVKNRAFTGSPIIATQRTDTDVTYALDEYTSDPIQIPNADTIELSYSKRESVLMEHEAALRQTIADIMIINWCPSVAGSIIRTTGEDTDTHLTGTTGTRKKMVTKDVKNAQKVMNKQNFPMEGRYALLSADMYSQLQDDMTQTQYRDFSSAMDEKTGVIGKLFGFTFYQRSAVASYTNDATPVVNAFGAAANVDDNDIALFWQVSAVERAVGATKFYQDQNNPLYFGDIYSMLQRMGGRKRRTNQEGIVALVQAAGGQN